MADDEDTAIHLLEEALHLLTNGEYAPGGYENWPNWIAEAEAFLRDRLTATRVEVIYLESWRPELWGEDDPSRPGWQVRCSEHGFLGKPPGWAYANCGTANMVATRHRHRHLRGELADRLS